MKQQYASLLKLSGKLITSGGSNEDILTAICHLLKEEIDHYDWVGIYISDPKKKELKLGPFAGEITEHIKIPFGEGICGQVAQNPRTFISRDVAGEDNYLACSPWVRSEIVVPIMKKGKFIAQLDIDSHTRNAFTDEDVSFLEDIAMLVSEIF